MKITLVCVGKIKMQYITEGIRDFAGRIAPYARLEILEIADEKIPQNPTNGEIKNILEYEGAKIEKYLAADSHKIALCIQGKQTDSIKFAQTIANLQTFGTSKLTFIIGGSLGLAESVVKSCQMQLSLSKMTFPHQLTRLILLEQIYRAFRIINNEPYHK